MKQFSLDYMLINIFSSIEPVPYKIEIKFDEFQKNRIIAIINMLSEALHNNNKKSKDLLEREKTHLLYDTIISRIKENQPLTCKQFQGLCGIIIESNIDRNNPTPNEKNIVHLISVAGGVLFDLNKLSTDELDKWIKQKNSEIILHHVKKAFEDYPDTH